jgi:hypothetical protein
MKELVYVLWSFCLITLCAYVVSCEKETTKPETIQYLQAASSIPCDSTGYRPVFSGQMMKVIPRTIAKWTYKGHDFWFAKLYAFSVVQPFNYQQDSLKERVVVSDTVQINYSDTFYICKKYKL